MEITKEEIMNQINESEKRFIESITKIYAESDEELNLSDDLDNMEARDRYIRHVEGYTSAIKRDMNIFLQMKG